MTKTQLLEKQIEIGNRLKDILSAEGLNQKELANGIGMTEITISRWIKGIRTPNAKEITKICNFLHVSANYLLCIDKEPSFDDLIETIKRNNSKWTSNQKASLINSLFD